MTPHDNGEQDTPTAYAYRTQPSCIGKRLRVLGVKWIVDQCGQLRLHALLNIDAESIQIDFG